MKTLTSFTLIKTGEMGGRMAFTFSEVSESGELESQNNKGNFIVVDPTLKRYVTAIENYIKKNQLGE